MIEYFQANFLIEGPSFIYAQRKVKLQAGGTMVIKVGILKNLRD